MAATVFVPLVIAENDSEEIPTVHVLPSVHVCPLTVVEVLASAEFGIALAATAKDGVDVLFVTVGTSHVGHIPEGAEKLVTVPEPALQLRFPEPSLVSAPSPCVPGSNTLYAVTEAGAEI